VLRHWPRRLGRERIAGVLHRQAIAEPTVLEGRATWGGRFACDLRDFVQYHIYYFSLWEPNLTALLTNRLRPGDVFVDVGANVGYFSLLASRLVRESGAVVAVDASPTIFGRLRETLRLNRANNVRAVNAAVSDREGVLSVYAGPPSNTGMTSTLAGRGGEYEADVRAAPLLALLTPEEAARTRLIKIDVEGAELPILLDILSNVDSFPDALEIVAEVSPSALSEAGTTLAELLDRFAERGFNWYLLDNDYGLGAYFDPQPRAAIRGRTVPTEQVDIVLSRHSGDKLW
jgi:FkbM family methyltransferase